MAVFGQASSEMETHEVWIVIFLLVILKIPIAYLCAVIYYAIKAEPRPEEGAAVDGGAGARTARAAARAVAACRASRAARPPGAPVPAHPAACGSENARR